jgi:hypothetical protein
MHLCNKFFQKNYISGFFVVTRQQDLGAGTGPFTGILYFYIYFMVLLNAFGFRQNRTANALLASILRETPGRLYRCRMQPGEKRVLSWYRERVYRRRTQQIRL